MILDPLTRVASDPMSDPVANAAPVTVMVVDDHPMWRDAVARDLADDGFSVVATAATGVEAITRARATRPDVVVLDLNIPPPSGVEVTGMLMAGDERPRVL